MPIPPKSKTDTLAQFREQMRMLSEKENSGKMTEAKAKVINSWGAPAATPPVKKPAAKAPATITFKRTTENEPKPAAAVPKVEDAKMRQAKSWASSTEVAGDNPFASFVQDSQAPVKTFNKGVAGAFQPTAMVCVPRLIE